MTTRQPFHQVRYITFLNVVIKCYQINSQAIIQNAKHITYHLISADNYVWNFPTTGIRKGAVIGNVLAKDPDQGLNSLIRYI